MICAVSCDRPFMREQTLLRKCDSVWFWNCFGKLISVQVAPCYQALPRISGGMTLATFTRLSWPGSSLLSPTPTVTEG